MSRMFEKPEPLRPPSFFDRIGDFYGSLNGWLQAVIVIGAAVGVLVTFVRWVVPHWSNFRSDMRSIRDTLVGRPAMRDSITKAIIPGTARPSIGQRMDEMAESLTKLADTKTRLDEHDRRLSRIEDALSIDKRLDKIESVQLLRTIESVAQAEPSHERPEGPRPD